MSRSEKAMLSLLILAVLCIIADQVISMAIYIAALFVVYGLSRKED